MHFPVRLAFALLSLCSLLLGQGTSPIQSESATQTTAPVSPPIDLTPNANGAVPPEQIRELLRRAEEKDLENDKRQRNYTYIERDEDRRRDPDGRVTAEHVDVSRTILVNGVPFEQFVERDGLRRGTEQRGSRQTDARNSRRAGRAIAQTGGGDRVDCPGSAHGFRLPVWSKKKQSTAGRPVCFKQRRTTAIMPQAVTAACFPRSRVTFGSISKTCGGSS